MRSIHRIVREFFVLAFIGVMIGGLDVSATHARDYVSSSVDPNTLRLDNYAGNDKVVIWAVFGTGTFPGGNCRSLELPAESTPGSRTRLFALVVTAKAAHKPMMVHYHPDDCTLMSFGADAW